MRTRMYGGVRGGASDDPAYSMYAGHAPVLGGESPLRGRESPPLAKARASL